MSVCDMYRRIELLPDPNSVVYFIERTDGVGPIKIGFTAHLKSRLNAIAKEIGRPVHVIAKFSGGRTAEESLHLRFGKRRVYGEWFERCKEIVDTAKYLNGAKANGW
jgi:acetyl-CoA carboxylase carboxyltransferase component